MKTKWQAVAKKVLFSAFILIAVFVVAKVLTRIMFLHWFYSPILNLLSENFGPATGIMKITALVGSVLAVMALPTVVAIILWGKRKKEVFVGLSALFLILSGAIFYESQYAFFDSATGEPVKYYCVTINGVKFSNTGGIDQESGATFKPVSKDLIKKYQIWEKYNRGEKTSYFDAITGEPNFKYSKTQEGNIFLYPSLYEFDPVNGIKLDFITAEIAAEVADIKDPINTTKRAISGISLSSPQKPQPTPPPRNVGWNSREISRDWTFIADIYNGDTVMFESEKPFKKLYKPSGMEYFENASNPGKYWYFTIGNCPPGKKCQMFFRSLDKSTFTVTYQIKRNM